MFFLDDADRELIDRRRGDLAYVLDDGRQHDELAYCACLRFTADNPLEPMRS